MRPNDKNKSKRAPKKRPEMDPNKSLRKKTKPLRAPKIDKNAPAISATMRIAKAIARAGMCSRREAETWVNDGRVMVNGTVLTSPALNVTPADKILIDGEPMPGHQQTLLYRYHKPKGQVTTHKDTDDRPTVFENLPEELPRLISIGRLDFNTEGLLLLTNDGALARLIELPKTGWLRRYKVRAHGRIKQSQLDRLKDGITIEGVKYGSIEATLERQQGANVWLTIGIREGKNREIRRVLSELDLNVNRLIRLSFGPFQLGDLKMGAVEEINIQILREQLGPKMSEQLGIGAPPTSDGKPKKPPQKIPPKPKNTRPRRNS